MSNTVALHRLSSLLPLPLLFHVSSLPSNYSPNPITDEVFAHLVLQPMAPEHFIPTNLSRFGRYEGDVEENKVITFAKILTPSDANNGGGFSVPRYCADSVFPPLYFHFQADPPVQKLFITDIHGVVWDFRFLASIFPFLAISLLGSISYRTKTKSYYADRK